MNKKVGIMGGTFNPIHNGHLILAETAREFLELDEILFMPSGNSYMKDTADIPEGRIRARMTALAVAGNPYFSLSMMEVERAGHTYTCDTIRALRDQYPENQYCFIMGADALLSLQKWKNPEYIAKNCIIAVALRNGAGEEIVREAAELTRIWKADIRLLPGRQIDLSSSEIRERLMAGKSVRYMLPEQVIEYIRENHLYNIRK